VTLPNIRDPSDEIEEEDNNTDKDEHSDLMQADEGVYF
jgi:hypothetical protein